MKNIILLTAILTIGAMANASELDCSANVSGKLSNQKIEIKSTGASFSAEAGEIAIGDITLSVYRNISLDTTYLHIIKKNNSTVTSNLLLATASSHGAQPGLISSLTYVLGSTIYKIDCSLK